MTKVTPKFLAQVQDSGWVISSVTGEVVVARCASAGCKMAAKLSPDRNVPTINRTDERTHIPIEAYDQLRQVLRERRKELCLSIAEVEDITGLTRDHLAKMEKDNPSKIPSAMIIWDWIQALGYEVVLRPKPLPKIALTEIVDTRDKAERRQARNEATGE